MNSRIWRQMASIDQASTPSLDERVLDLFVYSCHAVYSDPNLTHAHKGRRATYSERLADVGNVGAYLP